MSVLDVLITSFNWGEYALWHLGPRLRVSMDGRRETVYTDLRLAEYQAIVHGRPEGLAALAEWRAEYAWLPASSHATKAWLLANGYRVDFESAVSFVAVRSDLPGLDTFASGGPVVGAVLSRLRAANAEVQFAGNPARACRPFVGSRRLISRLAHPFVCLAQPFSEGICFPFRPRSATLFQVLAVALPGADLH